MQAQFWLDKWKEQTYLDTKKMGFHLGVPHPLLHKYYSKIFTKEQGVFLPLCGKSADLTFFAEKGGYTLGCELSEVAVNDYFSEHNNTTDAPPKIHLLQQHQLYQANNLEILLGDYFDLIPSQVERCQTIYDRAALIALPSVMRQAYVEQMKNLFQHAKLMLIAIEYEQDLMSGPPFSVTALEVERLFSFAKVERCYQKNIIEDELKFKDKGLNYFNETMYLIQW